MYCLVKLYHHHFVQAGHYLQAQDNLQSVPKNDAKDKPCEAPSLLCAQDVLDFVSETLKAMDKKEFEAKKFVSYKDRFQLFLIGALLLMVSDLFLFETQTQWLRKLNLFNENKNDN